MSSSDSFWNTFEYLYEFLGSMGGSKITDESQYFYAHSDGYHYSVNGYSRHITQEEAEKDLDLVVETIRLEITFLA
jgi:hypothetical protein